MGIVVLPLMLLIFIAWLSVALFIASRAQRLVRERFPSKRGLSFFSYPICLFLCWLIPNLPGLLEQLRMDSVSTQCGWSYDKQARGVSGVFIEAEKPEYMIDTFSGIYGAVEFAQGNRIAHWENRTVQYLTERTFRYGVRKTVSPVAYNIYREELLFLDFDTQEPLGKRVEYNFAKHSPMSSFFGIALYHLLYQPKPCGFTNPGQTDLRSKAIEILIPKQK